MNAQSTQSRYINPSTSTYLKTALYASTIQEKSKYVSCFTVQEMAQEGNVVAYEEYLDGQLDFYPTLVVQASNVANAQ